jgi:hypothetical protein
VAYRWSSESPEIILDDTFAARPTVFLAGPGVYPLSLDVGIGRYTTPCSTQVDAIDPPPPLPDSDFIRVADEENDEGDDGLHAVSRSGTDSPDGMVETTGYLDVYDGDKRLAVGDARWRQHPVNAGDRLRLTCRKKPEGVFHDEDSDADEDGDAFNEVIDPGMALHVAVVENSGTSAEQEQVLECPPGEKRDGTSVIPRNRGDEGRPTVQSSHPRVTGDRRRTVKSGESQHFRSVRCVSRGRR